VPATGATWWRKILAFAGPGYLVAVGYMDPGNWATDLAGGSRFGYTLLTVIMISNLMAIVLQGLSAKLGIVTGRDLAQACRDNYPKPVVWILWVLCELAIAACDLAEVIGSAIALNLLFGIPLPLGIGITALDVLLVLYLQNKGFRLLEALIIALVGTIGFCFLFEILLSSPPVGAVLKGFIPTAQVVVNPEMLYIALGILGATVMPHNLYLHSSIVQTRAYDQTTPGKKIAVKYAFIDSTIALSFALFINAARSRGEHRVRSRASRIRAGVHDHRYPRRPDRDGRIPEHPAAPMASATHHPGDRDHPGRNRRYHLRRERHGSAPRVQPGDPQPSALVCGLPSGHIHF
jgi:manganese transport protein